jgi:Uncharacterized protein conserved in bacteria
MGLLEQWREYAYNGNLNKQEANMLWAQYFAVEKEIYIELLADPSSIVSGTVKELADKYNTNIMTMVGFLDGIDESLKEANSIENDLTEDTKVKIDIDLEKLYYNMVAAKADWLYQLPNWETLLTEERRKEIYKEQKISGTVVKDKKVGRNDPCICGSGKKYKKCCGV